MTSIIEKQGSGWDNINEKTFFNQSKGNQRQDVIMSTSKEYEECTASLKPESLRKSSSPNDSTKQDTAKVQYVGRKPSASTATGYLKKHVQQQDEIISPLSNSTTSLSPTSYGIRGRPSTYNAS